MVFSQMSTLPAKMLHGERKEELKLGDNQQPVRASQDLIKKARVIHFKRALCWIPAAAVHYTMLNSPHTRGEFRK